MALTQSIMLPLGSIAPDFTLLDTVTNQVLTLSKQAPAKASVILFICNHCPFVKHILPTLVNIAEEYQLKGVRFYAISSNDAEQYPADSPENMHKMAKDCHFDFPYLYDETQAVAKLYNAVCTPDLYLFDSGSSLVYRGRFDGSTPGNDVQVSGEDLRTALDALLSDTPIPTTQYPSMGCNIKWKAS